jgi:hypothetical protein
MRRTPVAALCALAAALAAAAPPPAGAQQPAVRHVFTIVLENKDYDRTFGPGSPAPYLATELVSRGTLLPNYHATAHKSLPNYIALVSGQAPNPDTQADCQIFRDLLPGLLNAEGQAVGSGCVYPPEVQTVAGQLEAAHLTWRGYMEDMGADPAREPATCAHPPLNGRDGTQTATATDQYATRHNPFAYFHSIIDDQARCDRGVVGLDRLATDLQSTQTTPNYVFITPDLCHDGHDAPCADGSPGGYQGIDEFLAAWVPRITASPAFRADGLLVITFDEAEHDDSACCNEQAGPNTPAPGGQSGGPGGGRVGALLLGPYARPGRVVQEPINHYGLLRSVEDLFGLPRLGYAAQDGLKTLQDTGALRAEATAAPVLPPTAASCPALTALGPAAVRASGSTLDVLLPRAGATPVDAEVLRFADARGRPRRATLARLPGQASSFTWSAAGLRDGWYGVRLLVRAPGGTYVRSFGFRIARHRLVALPAYALSSDCGEPSRLELPAPVFRRNLSVDVRVSPGVTAALIVRRGSAPVITRVVRGSSATRHYVIRPRGRGTYRVTLSAGVGARRTTATVVSRRL